MLRTIMNNLASCADILKSSTPEDIDSFIDDNGLVENTIKALSKLTGGAVDSSDEVKVLEALCGLNFYDRSFADESAKNDLYSIKFISSPIPVIIVVKNNKRLVFNRSSEIPEE